MFHVKPTIEISERRRSRLVDRMAYEIILRIAGKDGSALDADRVVNAARAVAERYYPQVTQENYLEYYGMR